MKYKVDTSGSEVWLGHFGVAVITHCSAIILSVSRQSIFQGILHEDYKCLILFLIV